MAVTSYGRNKNHDDEIKKNIAGRIPETTRIVEQNNLYPNLDKIRISKKTLEITKIVDQYNIKSVNIFFILGVWVGAGEGGGGVVGGVGGTYAAGGG